MYKIITLVKRLNDIGISVELFANYPFIYLYKVNGKLVYEKIYSDHGFAIAFTPTRLGEGLKFTDIGETFQVIRKYCANDSEQK